METDKLLVAVDVSDLIGQMETLLATSEQFGEQFKETEAVSNYLISLEISLEKLLPRLPGLLRTAGEERGSILATRCWELYAVTKWRVLAVIANVARPLPSFYPSMRLVQEGRWYVATYPQGGNNDPEASARHQLEVLRTFWRNTFEILPFHVHILGFDSIRYVSQWEKGEGVSIWDKVI